MKDTRRARWIGLAGVFAAALGVGIFSRIVLASRIAASPGRVASAEDDLRDAVASASVPAFARVAGKPIPASWMKSPQKSRDEVTGALWASRRRRLLVSRRPAAQ